MKHAPPAPPSELGKRDGLAYALFLPEADPSAGVVVMHGAGSAKENHFDFARTARAAGLAALCFDARGHGESSGEFGPGALEDALQMRALLREHAPAVALRGSSMGGFVAVHAAAAAVRAGSPVCAVVAICPAPGELLAEGLRRRRLVEFRADERALLDWLPSLDLAADAAALSPSTALLLLHAEGDEAVPVSVSRSLYEAAGDPKRLLVIPGGHHRSIQHDLELQAESIRFVARAAAGAAN